MRESLNKIVTVSKAILQRIKDNPASLNQEILDYILKRIQNLIITAENLEENALPSSDQILNRLIQMLEKADLILQNLAREKKNKGFIKMLSIFKSHEDTAESLKKIFDNISASILDLSSAISAKNLQLMDSIKIKQKDMDEKLAVILEKICNNTNITTPDDTTILKMRNGEILNNIITICDGKNFKTPSAFPQQFIMPTLDEVDWGKSNILTEENNPFQLFNRCIRIF